MIKVSARQRVLDHYGAMCATPGCGVSDPDQLCIDHVYGGGSQERKLTRKSSEQKYQLVIDEGFPKPPHPRARQLQCMNCHATKTKHERQLWLGGSYMAGAERYQINSGVSKELHSYIKDEKVKRNCTEKQLLQEMYESHVKSHGAVSLDIMSALQEIHEQLAEIHALLAPQSSEVVDEKPALRDEFDYRLGDGEAGSTSLSIHRPSIWERLWHLIRS